MGKKLKQWQILFSWAPKSLQNGDCSHEIKRCLHLRRKAMMNLESVWKSRDITLPTKVHLVKAMALPVVMCGCESWTIKKVEHQRIDALELWCCIRFLRDPWTCKETKPINPKGNQSWVFIGCTDAEAEAPIFWPHDMEIQLIGKDLDAGKDWRQKEKIAAKDEIIR